MEQGRAGQGRAGQGRAGQDRAGQSRAGQGRAGQRQPPTNLERSTSTCPLVSLLRPSSTVERLRRKTPLRPDSAPTASAATPMTVRE